MRRAIIVLCAIVALLVSASPVAARGNTFHFSASDRGAEAFWTTFPVEGEPEPGVVYTDTFVFASQSAINEDGTTFSDKFVFVDRFSFSFDRRGNFTFESATFGFASGDDVALTVGAKLQNASVAATVSLETCTEDRRGNFICEAAGTGSLTASWTGQGELIRANGTFHQVSKTFTFNSHFKGTFRNATATGQLDGSDFGTNLFADIFNASFKDVSVCHGC